MRHSTKWILPCALGGMFGTAMYWATADAQVRPRGGDPLISLQATINAESGDEIIVNYKMVSSLDVAFQSSSPFWQIRLTPTGVPGAAIRDVTAFSIRSVGTAQGSALATWNAQPDANGEFNIVYRDVVGASGTTLSATLFPADFIQASPGTHVPVIAIMPVVHLVQFP